MPFLQKLNQIDRTCAHFRRYMQIIDALLQFGFGNAVAMLNTDRFRESRLRRWLSRRSRMNDQSTAPERVRMLLQSLGPTFVKLGQVLASRPELLPESYVKELVKLQDRVPSEPWEVMREILKEEWHKSPEEVVKSIDHEPFAAASIGQAYRAVLLDGTKVVIKVRRPGIEEKIRIDLEILYYLASSLERVNPDYKVYRPAAAVEEFGHALRQELDFRVEGANAARFSTLIQNQKGVYSPKVYKEYSGKTVLVEEAIEGDSAKAVLASPELQEKYDLKSIAGNGIDSMMEQIFVNGFFHADPHAGNMILMQDSKLCFIEFGMMGRVTVKEREDFIRAVRAVLGHDIPRLVHCMMRLSTPLAGLPDKGMMERDLADLVDTHLYLPLSELSLAAILEQLMKVLAEHRLALLPDLYILFKALITAEHIAKAFDPELPVMEILSRTMQRTILPELDIRKQAMKMRDECEDLLELGKRAPVILGTLFDRIEKDAFQLHVEYAGMENMRRTLAHSAHQLACAIVLASIVVGSSLVVLSGIPPLWCNIPVLGVLGFVFAGIVAAILLFTSRKYW